VIIIVTGFSDRAPHRWPFSIRQRLTRAIRVGPYAVTYLKPGKGFGE